MPQMKTLPHRTAILMLFPGLSIAFILLTILRSGDVPFVARVDVWSIGIYSGESPFDISPDADTLNPVLTAADVTDTPAISVADPFLFRDESSWFLFFEVLNSDLDGRLIRIAQDDDPTYGNGVRAFQVTQLTQSGYEEQEIPGSPHLTGSGRGWNRSGMHHADWIQIRPGKWIAAVDGRRTRIAFGSEY